MFSGINGDLVYVSVVNTPSLFTYHHGDQYINYMDLYDVFPNSGASMQASIKIAPLGNPLRGQVLLFEEKVCSTYHDKISPHNIYVYIRLFCMPVCLISCQTKH